MFTKLLIANRGAISRRISRTLKAMQIASVAVYSEADADSIHVREADESVLLGPAPVTESYLRVDKILAAAHETGAKAIHPGYGFLSENADFAQACEDAGIAFVGPTPEQMRVFGLKHTAREIAGKCNVPLLPGTGLLANAKLAVQEAEKIGYPVMLKSTAGGGGIGMKICWSEPDLEEAFASVERMSRNNFKDSGIFLEKFVANARHIEVQIFGDGKGRILALGERDCSTQRRNQKVIEETPAIGISDVHRESLFAAAIKLGEAVNYRSAGTVEFVFDADTGNFYFLEVNTRLQVEHGVTEEVCGIDLVEWMVRLAMGDETFLDDYIHRPTGHSIQVRIYAEDPAKYFQPSCGLLTEVIFHDGPRFETWVETGTEVTPYYDPMLAKIIVVADDRATAIRRMLEAVDGSSFAGIETNLDYLRCVIASQEFADGLMTTRSLDRLDYQPDVVEILEGGAQTTIQDYPGRVGFWAVGVPPSGPMDHRSFRLANRLVGNIESAAGLEFVMTGPSLRFACQCEIALTGADFQASINGKPVDRYTALSISPGDVLRMPSVAGPGCRGYLAIRGGWQVPRYLGSRATFTLGKFGGHGGRALRSGDILHPGTSDADLSVGTILPPKLVPELRNDWTIGVIYGPHGAPDFFTDDDMLTFFSTDWKVHYNSSRTGVRLIGPKPTWARADGGEAGLHPSNIHDNAYAIGAVDFTGDMPIILGPDGPSLGGFVCPACILQSELWKIGQLKAGDTVRFVKTALREATARELEQDREIESLFDLPDTRPRLIDPIEEEAVEHEIPEEQDRPKVVYRRAGDHNILVEYGSLILDLTLRFRIHALMEWLEQHHVPGILDLTPGIRSLQIHYDNRVIPLRELMELLIRAESDLPDIDEMSVPSRIVHLPLSWDDPSTQLAIEKYMTGVRPDAPWCPSNIEFIRRINGLDSIDEVRDIVFQASYLVLGLGDVYLGAPVATPLDPRHRLVTTKYNPARTWTPENAVGIGGAYMCVYGMEGPGGYQFVGRTVQMWNAWHATKDFTDGTPWLLRFFDQVRFYPVSAAELVRLRADFLVGRFELRMEDQVFRLADYQAFLERDSVEIKNFRQKQRTAFAAERERWQVAGQDVLPDEPEPGIVSTELVLPAGGRLVVANLPGSVWQVLVEVGQVVAEGEKLVILESMKMETAIFSPSSGRIDQILVSKGSAVEPGQNLLVLIENQATDAR